VRRVLLLSKKFLVVVVVCAAAVRLLLLDGNFKKCRGVVAPGNYDQTGLCSVGWIDLFLVWHFVSKPNT
jgi:hypothetical protein